MENELVVQGNLFCCQKYLYLKVFDQVRTDRYVSLNRC